MPSSIDQVSGPQWLPSTRKPLLTKPPDMYIINKLSETDGFFRTIQRIRSHHPEEGLRFAQLYAFVREYMPHGLVGPWEHIHGKRIMELLLSSASEQAGLEDSTLRDAEAAFSALEEWISLGVDWQAALQSAQNNSKQDNPQAQGSSEQQMDARKAPALHSPTRLMALLVLAYPDTGLLEKIRKLQVGWMMEPRETLDVQEGFWKGINSGIIATVFSLEVPERGAGVELSLDYTKLFGASFLRCLLDNDAYLPVEPTPQGVVGDSSGSGVVDDEASERADVHDLNGDPQNRDVSDAVLPAVSADGVFTDDCGNQAELKLWLAASFNMVGVDTLMYKWADQWAYEIEVAGSHGEQLLIQSLILRSAYEMRRLFQSSSSVTTPETIMLWDLVNFQLTFPPPREKISKLDYNSRYKVLAGTNAKLARCLGSVSPRAVKTLVQVTSQQANLFSHMLTRRSFFRHLDNLMECMRHETQQILDVLRKPGLPMDKMRARLWDDNTIASLKLTNRQLLQCFHPSLDTASILTQQQLRTLARSTSGVTGKGIGVDPSEMVPIIPKLSINGFSLQHGFRRDIMTSLVGELHPVGLNQSMIREDPGPDIGRTDPDSETGSQKGDQGGRIGKVPNIMESAERMGDSDTPSSQSDLASTTDSLETKIQAVAKAVENLDARCQVFENSFRSVVEEIIKETLEVLRASQALQPPSVGEPGYPTHHGLAPRPEVKRRTSESHVRSTPDSHGSAAPGVGDIRDNCSMVPGMEAAVQHPHEEEILAAAAATSPIELS